MIDQMANDTCHHVTELMQHMRNSHLTSPDDRSHAQPKFLYPAQELHSESYQ
jgi:hypothetical protein